MEKRDQNTTKTTQPKLWTPVFVAIIAFSLCCFMVGQGLNAGTSVHLSYRGETAALAGIGAAVFSIAAAVSRIVFGPLADLRGRLLVITIGAIVLIAGTAGAAFLPDMKLFILWRFLQGVGFATVTTAAATAAADVLPVERLGEGIGYYGLGQAIAMSIGPALAIFLVSTDPAENLFRGLSIAATAVLVLSFFAHYENNLERLPETATYRRIADQRAKKKLEREQKKNKSASTERQPKESFLHKIFEPKALAGALPIMVICPTFGFGIFFTGLFGTKLGIANAGLFYTVSAFAMIAVRLASKSFMDRTPAIRLHIAASLAGLVYCGMLIAVGLIPLDETARNILFYLAGIPYGLCMGVGMPVNQTVSVRYSPPERWGAANGLYYLLTDVGIGIASTIWGITNDNLGFTTTLCFVALLIVLSVGVAWLSYPAAEKR